MTSAMDARTVKLLRLGPDQVIEIPADWELPGTDVKLSRDGERLIIAPRKPDDRAKVADD